MKAFFKVIVATLLATTHWLAQDTHVAISKDIETSNFLKAQAQIKAEQSLVSVALPILADVYLKGGGSVSGRVKAIDSQSQQLSLDERSGRAAPIIPLSRIENVVFKNDAVAYRSNGRPIYRGERERPVGKSVAWSSFLNTFRVRDAVLGLAVMRLGQPISPANSRGILAVARDRQYVVNEIRFDLQKRTMTIQATPY